MIKSEKIRFITPNSICKALIQLFFCFFLLGCSTVRPDGARVKHYLGYVRVIVPPSYPEKEVQVTDVTTVGVHIANGIGIGYQHNYHLSVPLDCRLVVIVKNQQQLDHALKTLSKTLKEGLCLSVQP